MLHGGDVHPAAKNPRPPTSSEARFTAARGVAEDERMAGQAVVRGDSEITTSFC